MKKIYVKPQTELLVLKSENICFGSLDYTRNGGDRAKRSLIDDDLWDEEW